MKTKRLQRLARGVEREKEVNNKVTNVSTSLLHESSSRFNSHVCMHAYMVIKQDNAMQRYGRGLQPLLQ